MSVIKDVCTAKFKRYSGGTPTYRIVRLGGAQESDANSDQSGVFVRCLLPGAAIKKTKERTL